MKNNFKNRFRSILASVLTASVLMLSLAACRNAAAGKASGELSAAVSGAGAERSSTVSSAFSAASSEAQPAEAESVPAGSAASSAAVSALPSLTTSSSASSVPAERVSKPPVTNADDGVQTVKKIAVAETSGQTGTLDAAADVQSGYQKMDQRSAYGVLTIQGEKDLYELIGKAVYQISDTPGSSGYYTLQTITVPSGLKEAQICETLVAYQDDNPQVFWMANAYSIGTKGNTAYLQLYSNLSLQQCSEYNQKFTAAVSAALASVPSGLNEFGREEAIFNYIVGLCGYDDSAAADSGIWQSYTAYGALVNGKAVCEGYSRAMQLLCGYTGLQCILTRGTAEGENHMWNCVSIDGHWYHFDVTWCDNTSLIYSYFNIPDSVLTATHTPAPAVSSMSDSQITDAAGFYNLVVPVCDSTLANYYLVRGIHIGNPGGLSDDEIVSAIAERMKSGGGTIAFSVGPDSDFDAAVQDLLQKMPAYLRSSAKAAGKTLNFNSIRYLSDRPDLGVNIIISYAE